MATESSFELPGGLRIAAQSWGDPAASLRILALHGWMDNSSTFALVAPALVARTGAYVVAADLPGHGRSAHRAASSYYATAEYTANAAELWKALRWERGVLLGHSLGAGIASVVAAAFPEAVAAVLLVDGLGPYPQPIEQTVATFRRAVDAKPGYLAAPRSVYPSVDAAAAHRVAAVARNPGRQWISLEGARALVERALEPASPAELATAAAVAAEAAAAAGSSAPTAAPTSGFCFRHDPKIKGPAPHGWSEEQAQAFLAAIACPVLHVAAVDGWPRPPAVVEARLRLVRDLRHLTLPGSHHLHADPDTAPAVINEMARFLRERCGELLGAAAPAAAACVAGGAAGSSAAASAPIDAGGSPSADMTTP